LCSIETEAVINCLYDGPEVEVTTESGEVHEVKKTDLRPLVSAAGPKTCGCSVPWTWDEMSESWRRNADVPGGTFNLSMVDRHDTQPFEHVWRCTGCNSELRDGHSEPPEPVVDECNGCIHNTPADSDHHCDWYLAGSPCEFKVGIQAESGGGGVTMNIASSAADVVVAGTRQVMREILAEMRTEAEGVAPDREPLDRDALRLFVHNLRMEGLGADAIVDAIWEHFGVPAAPPPAEVREKAVKCARQYLSGKMITRESYDWERVVVDLIGRLDSAGLLAGDAGLREEVERLKAIIAKDGERMHENHLRGEELAADNARLTSALDEARGLVPTEEERRAIADLCKFRMLVVTEPGHTGYSWCAKTGKAYLSRTAPAQEQGGEGDE
jgi:hypothetical protein